MMGQATSITITMTQDGKVGVAGPLENKLLCYGLLEIARQSVQNYSPEVKPMLALPPAGLKIERNGRA